MKAITNKLKSIKKKILTSNATPFEISIGFSIGIFVSFIPIVPIQTLLLLFLMFIIKKSNKVAAYASSWLMNQFTIIPIYLFIFWVGTFFYPSKIQVSTSYFSNLLKNITFNELLNLGGELFIPLIIGGLISGIFFALLSYFILFFILKRKMS